MGSQKKAKNNVIHNVIALPFKEHRVDRPKKKAYSKYGVSYDLQ